MQSKHTIGHMILDISDDNTTVEIKEIGDPFVQNTGDIEVNKNAYLTLMKRFVDELNGGKPKPKYILFDTQVVRPDGGRREKVVLISWCPDSCGVHAKTLHAGTLEDVRKAASGALYVAATDADDIKYEVIAKLVQNS